MTALKIAFYSPLKPPDHLVPSGDRLMARLLIECLTGEGYQVELASSLRVFVKQPSNRTVVDDLMTQAESEIQRLTKLWLQQGPPALWFCYHPYYKSPDLIGPELSRAFNIPYVTAEASYSGRRNEGVWGQLQQMVLASIDHAAVNICFTERDIVGLQQVAPAARLARLRPFINTTHFSKAVSRPAEPRLVTVAMMRSGDKFDSYVRLAAALKLLVPIPWTLSVVGDGPMRDEVQALFCELPDDRILWHGQQQRAEIAALFAQSTLYVWPGCSEAYGLAYLEAQAAGLPVIAYDNAGVPEVVDHGVSGILTPLGDDQAYAAAIEKLLGDEQQCQLMSRQAHEHVHSNHGITQAGKTLDALLKSHLGLTA